MPVDFSKYIDLSIFNSQPGDIYLDAIEAARTTMPDFNLRIGTPEDAIFQAASYISALNIAAINRLPDRLMAGIAGILGVPRQDAIPAEVDITITADSYVGTTVPSGSLFGHSVLFEDELQEFVFETNDALVIDAIVGPAPGDPYPSGTVAATCLFAGVIPTIPDATELSILSSGLTIYSALTAADSNFSNGIAADLDHDYLSRVTTHLKSLSSAINTSSQLDAYILSNYADTVSRVKSYDLTYGDETLGDISVARTITITNKALTADVATLTTSAAHVFIVGDVVTITGVDATFNGTFTIVAVPLTTTLTYTKVAANVTSAACAGTASGGQPISGYVTVFAYGLNTFLTATQKTTIFNDISGFSVAGLVFAVKNPTLLTLTITGDIIIDDRYNATSLQTSIESALVETLSPKQYSYSEDRIRLARITTLIMSIPGVVYTENLVLTSSGNGWLPKLGNDLLFHTKGSLPILTTADITFTYTATDITY